jgi:PGF-pre-PGF domain-containing protein
MKLSQMFNFKFIALFLVLILSAVGASGEFQNSANFIFKSGSTPVTNVDVIGYQCSDSSCSSLGTNFVPMTNTGSSNSKLVYFPITTETVNYGMYFGNTCYAPYEASMQNDGANYPTENVNIPLTKVQNAKSPIVQMDLYNTGRRDHPIIFSVTAQLDAVTKSAFSHAGPLSAVPAQFKDYYSALTDVKLQVFNADNEVVYTQTKQVNIYAEETADVSFTFTPNSLGTFTARVTTDVIDCQCDQNTKVPQSISRTFLVYIDNEVESCQTNMMNYRISPSPADVGQEVTVTVDRLSVWQHNDGDRDQVPTELTFEIKDARDVVVHTQKVTAPAVASATHEEPWSFKWTPLAAGEYILKVNGVAKSSSCSGLSNANDYFTNSLSVEGDDDDDDDDTTAPSPISNLHTVQITKNLIKWSWNAPPETDTAGYKIYINGVFKENVVSPSYTATGLTADTSYTINVHTYDTHGNVNTTDVKNTAKTSKGSDDDPDTEIGYIHTYEPSQSMFWDTISTNEFVSETVDIDFEVLLHKIEFTAKKQLENVRITFGKLDTDAYLASLKGEKLLSVFDIAYSNLDYSKISGFALTFKMPRTELIKYPVVHIWEYNSGKWTLMNAVESSKDSTYAYYTVKPTGLSIRYAVTVAQGSAAIAPVVTDAPALNAQIIDNSAIPQVQEDNVLILLCLVALSLMGMLWLVYKIDTRKKQKKDVKKPEAK